MTGESTNNSDANLILTEAAASAGEDSYPRGWYTIFILSIVVAFSQIDRGVIALLVQPIKRDLDLSDTEVSYLIGIAFTVSYAAFGPPMSRFADRGVRKYLVAGSLAVWSLATTLCGLAQHFWHIFASRAVIGGAEGAFSPASFSMVADSVPQSKLPRAYAVYNGGFMLGIALSMALGGLLIGYLEGIGPVHFGDMLTVKPWQMVFIVVGFPGILWAALLVLTVPEPKRHGRRKPEGYPLREVFGFIIRNRAIHLPLLSGILINSIQTFGAAAWVPAFYERTYGWGPAMAGPMLGMVSLVTGTLGLLLGAQLAEWLGKRLEDANLRVLFLANVVSIPFAIASPLMPTPWLALGCGAIGGIIATMGGPGYNSALQLSTPNEMRAQVNALYLFSMSAIGGALGPLAVALITDNVASSEADLRYVLVGFRAVLAPLDAFLIWLAVRPYGRAFLERRREEAQA